jgi:hypothetical protein
MARGGFWERELLMGNDLPAAHGLRGPEGHVTALFALPLVLPRASLYSRLGVPPEATAEEIRAAMARLHERLKARGASTEEIAKAHAVNLESHEARATHDAEHPPLSLMRLDPTWEPVFTDRATALAVLRREIEDFLRHAGETVHHPSDITRTDFTGDFTHTRLLDDVEIE